MLNGVSHYTIFNVPIAVTNSIPAINSGTSNSAGGGSQGGRPSCERLDNPLASFEEAEAAFLASTRDVGVLFAPGDATVVQQTFPVPGLGAGTSLRSSSNIALGAITVAIGAVVSCW